MIFLLDLGTMFSCVFSSDQQCLWASSGLSSLGPNRTIEKNTEANVKEKIDGGCLDAESILLVTTY